VVSLGPHCAYFHRRKLKPKVEKVSTVADKLSFHFKSHSLSIKRNLLECSTKLPKKNNLLNVYVVKLAILEALEHPSGDSVSP